VYGDTYYKYVASGSTATSAATEHRLLGVFGGLSQNFNARGVLHMQAYAVGATAVIGPSGSISATTGFHLLPSASMVDFPPMTVDGVNQLALFRNTGTDTTVYWTLWRRVA
jgi:hypothetical protein